MSITNRLSSTRQSRGLSAADLAKRTGVTRQTIHAIEAGDYVPNTAVALKLARELEVTVEELFSLETSESARVETVDVAVLARTPEKTGRPLQLSKVGAQWIGVPATPSPYFLPDSDGLVARGHTARLLGDEQELAKRLVLAGCDPALSLLARVLQRTSGMEMVNAPASSRLALDWLKQGRVHVAGTHLEDERTGEFNTPYLRENFPGEDLTVVTFASWEEGFVVASGNPKKIREAADLFRKNVRFVNREAGAGSRTLLDRLIRESGGDKARVRGYESVAYGHLAAAQAVALGEADCCLATSSAARAFGLDFVAVRRERFDLVLKTPSLDLPPVRAMLDVLQRAVLRRKLEALAGYETSRTGSMVEPEPKAK